MVKCEVLGSKEHFRKHVYVFSKACQYAIDDEKGCKAFKYVSIKFTHAYLNATIILCHSHQTLTKITSHVPLLLTWDVSQIIIDISSPIINACVLTNHMGIGFFLCLCMQ
jgi:hypothetical protein